MMDRGPAVRYGFKCPCHGTQIFDSQRQRDAYAITFQCRLELFRIVPDEVGPT